MSGRSCVAVIISVLLFCIVFPTIFLPIIRRVDNHILMPFTVTNITQNEKFVAEFDCQYCVPVRLDDVKSCSMMVEMFNWFDARRCRLHGECPKSQECSGDSCCAHRREITTIGGFKRGECQKVVPHQSCIAHPHTIIEATILELPAKGMIYNYTRIFDSEAKYKEFYRNTYNSTIARYVNKTTLTIDDDYYYRTGEIWGLVALSIVCGVLLLLGIRETRR